MQVQVLRGGRPESAANFQVTDGIIWGYIHIFWCYLVKNLIHSKSTPEKCLLEPCLDASLTLQVIDEK